MYSGLAWTILYNPRMALNFWSFCFRLHGAGVTDVQRHSQLTWCWEKNPGRCARWARSPIPNPIVHSSDEGVLIPHHSRHLLRTGVDNNMAWLELPYWERENQYAMVPNKYAVTSCYRSIRHCIARSDNGHRDLGVWELPSVADA